MYSRTITRIVVGLDILLLVITSYQVFIVARANQVSMYEMVFWFWVAGFIGAAITTCALKFRVVTFFAVPFFFPAIWFLVTCTVAYIHHPMLFDVYDSVFWLTLLFLVVYLGFVIVSVYMGIKRLSMKQGIRTDSASVEDVIEEA